MVILETFQTRLDASMYCEMLDNADIPYIIQGADCGGQLPSNNSLEGFAVMISEDDLDDAKKLIEEEQALFTKQK